MESIQETRVEEEPGGKKSELLVYVYNITEDEWSYIESVSHRPQQNHLIAECENATDAYFLSMATESDFIYISPKPISPKFQEYAKKLLAFRQATVLLPQNKTHLICDDLIRDSVVFGQLLEQCRRYKKINLISFAASSQFYSLADALRREGLVVATTEAPDPGSAWTVNFYGSKSGIRQLAQKSVAREPDFKMAEGLICVGRYDAAKIAADRYVKQKGVVIKTNKGSGGNGVLIFREGDLPLEHTACEKAILTRMNSDKYWDYFPIIIENLITINLDQNTSLPNVEFKIHKSGRIEFLYYCTCKVTREGYFYGVDINDDVVPDRLATQITDTCYFIAEQYAAAGYRGHFDVDMMLSKNGEVFVCESNCRNTGGTDTFRIARKLIGKDFMEDSYVLSRSKYELPNHHDWKFTSVVEALTPALYSSKKKEGVIINSENSILDGHLIYTVIGKTKKKAYDLEAQMVNLLASAE